MNDKKERPPDDVAISHLEAILEYYQRQIQKLKEQIAKIKIPKKN